ncbi:MAG: UDP-N-acetylglucosamine pyrophosphorylase [Deltaproteobacteria bacterium]|nr:UDP-N-acetylglucosamine pyrophosphorylase [Deltaproteobacteria bacterium]
MPLIGSKIETLLNKGVTIHKPESVHIDEDVDPERISGDGVVIYPGCGLYGKSTLIMAGTRLGEEAPVAVENCQLGPGVELKGGYFKRAVFLEKANAGSGAHVREGTILEEQAGIAHTVGLKQTILFPFVTLGSLINFCDCLMAGGTSRRNHSEVGSSYIHFNFTPNQDKATASLIGDVPGGVMLDQPPVFLGGQGGLVGPCRLAFGTTIAAGSIYRKDELRPDRLLVAKQARGGSMPFVTGVYRVVKRIFVNNINYIGNLFALLQWYRNVRALFISKEFAQPLLDGLIFNAEAAILERIERLEAFCGKLPASADMYRKTIDDDPTSRLLAQKKELDERWPDVKLVLKEAVNHEGDPSIRDRFLETLLVAMKNEGKDYLRVITALEQQQRREGTKWLQGIVDRTTEGVLALLPSLG